MFFKNWLKKEPSLEGNEQLETENVDVNLVAQIEIQDDQNITASAKSLTAESEVETQESEQTQSLEAKEEKTEPQAEETLEAKEEVENKKKEEETEEETPEEESEEKPEEEESEEDEEEEKPKEKSENSATAELNTPIIAEAVEIKTPEMVALELKYQELEQKLQAVELEKKAEAEKSEKAKLAQIVKEKMSFLKDTPEANTEKLFEIKNAVNEEQFGWLCTVLEQKSLKIEESLDASGVDVPEAEELTAYEQFNKKVSEMQKETGKDRNECHIACQKKYKELYSQSIEENSSKGEANNG